MADLIPIRNQPFVISRDALIPYVDEIQRLKRELRQAKAANADDRLRRVLDDAHAGLRIYRKGASAEALSQVLRDIVSDANRAIGARR